MDGGSARSTTWYSASGGCSSTLAQIDKMLLKQADKQEEDEFKKPKPADSPSKQLAGKRKLEEEGGPGPSTDDWQASYAKQSWQDGIFRLGDTLVFGTGAWQRSVDLPAGHTIEAGCCLARYLAHVNNRPGFQKMALWCSSPKVCITTYTRIAAATCIHPYRAASRHLTTKALRSPRNRPQQGE